MDGVVHEAGKAKAVLLGIAGLPAVVEAVPADPVPALSDGMAA